MKKTLTFTAVALSLMASPLLITSAAAQPTQQFCPPGLAKKDPPCVPPGQARQGVTTEEWLNRHSIGDRIDADDYIYLREYDYAYWSTLPPLGASQAYVVLNDGVIVLDQTTSTILSLINILAN